MQVIQQPAALSYQLHQSAVSGKIFFVLLKMCGDLRDTLCKQSDLAFNGTCVGCGTPKL